MKKYRVIIEEKLVYQIEVEAKNEDEAIDKAYQDFKFTDNIPDDNDSIVASIEEI